MKSPLVIVPFCLLLLSGCHTTSGNSHTARPLVEPQYIMDVMSMVERRDQIQAEAAAKRQAEMRSGRTSWQDDDRHRRETNRLLQENANDLLRQWMGQ
jgi:hypothetical protein